MEKTGRWYLIGIVSAGYSCAQRGQPGIYHRVAHTVDWISYIINSTWSWLPSSYESDLLSSISRVNIFILHKQWIQRTTQSQKVSLWTLLRTAFSFLFVDILCTTCYTLVLCSTLLLCTECQRQALCDKDSEVKCECLWSLCELLSSVIHMGTSRRLETIPGKKFVLVSVSDLITTEYSTSVITILPC